MEKKVPTLLLLFFLSHFQSYPLIFYFCFYCFYCFYFPNSQPSSLREKGPFASLARHSILHHFYLLPSSPTAFATFVLLSGGCKSAGGAPLAFFFLFLFLPPTPNPVFNDFKPTHCTGWSSYFSLPFIWVSLLKDRVVAMGKPHCNYSI